jgi:hypothetical protein
MMLAASSFALGLQADDLHFKKNITVEGNSVSGSETWVKGARERSVTKSPAGEVVSLRQCDLKRTVVVNEQSKAYFVINDPQDQSAANAAALMTGAPVPAAASGGVITQTVSITDTGERKLISGYPARHLKTTVAVESSPNACSAVKQKYDIDGWYTDLTKEQLSCSQSLPPVKLAANCTDSIVVRHKGSAKPGYPLRETIILQNEGADPTKIEVATSEISKEPLKPELFDVPADFHEVHSQMELYSSVASPQSMPGVAMSQAVQPAMPMNAMPQQSPMGNGMGMPSPLSMMAQAMSGHMPNGGPGMQGTPAAAAAVPLPQALGPKAPGKIRIGIAPAQAQMGQGNNAQADYGTPVRNAIVFMMNGPAVEIAALDAQVPIQLQAEAQQKQCDYILVSSVTVKHANNGNLDKFMKVGSMAANFTPLGMMAHSMGAVNGMIATQTVMQTAAMSTQQLAMSQLSGFNGQIKSKDEVTVDYQLVPTGATQPKLQNSLKGKSKSDGEDVLTPLIQQAANTILTEVTKK